MRITYINKTINKYYKYPLSNLKLTSYFDRKICPHQKKTREENTGIGNKKGQNK